MLIPYIGRKDLKQMIQSSPSWRKAFGIQSKHDQNESEHLKLQQEAQIVTKELLEKSLSKENIIEDSSDIKALANLHESLEWLTLRLRNVSIDVLLELSSRLFQVYSKLFCET